jgi:hypothetical protein
MYGMNIWQVIAVILGVLSMILIVNSITLFITLLYVPDKIYGLFLCVVNIGIARAFIGFIRSLQLNGFLRDKKA